MKINYFLENKKLSLYTNNGSTSIKVDVFKTLKEASRMYDILSDLTNITDRHIIAVCNTEKEDKRNLRIEMILTPYNKPIQISVFKDSELYQFALCGDVKEASNGAEYISFETKKPTVSMIQTSTKNQTKILEMTLDNILKNVVNNKYNSEEIKMLSFFSEKLVRV